MELLSFLILTNNKIAIIRALRRLTDLGLAECRDAVVAMIQLSQLTDVQLEMLGLTVPTYPQYALERTSLVLFALTDFVQSRTPRDWRALVRLYRERAAPSRFEETLASIPDPSTHAC